VANDPTDPRNDPTMLRVPFIFVKRGDPPPLRWMAEHPGYLKVPAIMVPHGTEPPWPWAVPAAARRRRRRSPRRRWNRASPVRLLRRRSE